MLSEWEDIEFSVENVMATTQYLHEEVFEKLKLADMKNKDSFDARQSRFQGKY